MAPHERARIRYFRTIGLNDWKLFEIAAILPLVLQLALALFFVGLCLFTWSVHRSIGATSVCLVTGWAVFFILALLAPILSPRCPYKTTFLKVALSRTRIFVLSATRYARGHPTFRPMRRFLSKLQDNVVHISSLSWLTVKMVARATRTLLQPRRNIQEGASDIDDDDNAWSPFRYIQDDISGKEETHICRQNVNDTIILLDIDIMQNDELLVAMQAALQQTPLPPETVLRFALDVVGRRLNRRNLHEHMFSWQESLDLRAASLTDIARNSTMNIVAEGVLSAWDRSRSVYLSSAIKQFPSILQACQFLVSKGGSVTPKVKSLIQKMLHDALSGSFVGIDHSPRRNSGHAQRFSSVISNIRDVLLALEAKHAHDLLKVFFQCYFWEVSSNDTSDGFIPRSLLAERLHWEDINNVDVSCRSLVALFELALTAIYTACNQRWATHQNRTLPPSEVELLETVLDIIPVLVERRAVRNFRESSLSGAPIPILVFQRLLSTPEALHRIMDSILARSDSVSTGAGAIPLLDSMEFCA